MKSLICCTIVYKKKVINAHITTFIALIWNIIKKNLT